MPTIDLVVILGIVWLHFIGDFILQTDRMAQNKSTDNAILGEHVVIYSIPFVLFGLKFAITNMVLHYIVDFCTSRATSYLWKKNERHWFFVVIGLDQALHFTCLFTTYAFLIHPIQ
jgi:hypothetical protein